MKTKETNIEVLADILCNDMEYYNVVTFQQIDSRMTFLSKLWYAYWNLTPTQRLLFDIPEYTQMINTINDSCTTDLSDYSPIND